MAFCDLRQHNLSPSAPPPEVKRKVQPRDLAATLEEAGELIERLGGLPIVLSPRFGVGREIVLSRHSLEKIFARVQKRSLERKCFASKISWREAFLALILNRFAEL